MVKCSFLSMMRGLLVGSQRASTGLKLERGEGDGEGEGSDLHMETGERCGEGCCCCEEEEEEEEDRTLLWSGEPSGNRALCLETSGDVLGRGLHASRMPWGLDDGLESGERLVCGRSRALWWWWRSGEGEGLVAWPGCEGRWVGLTSASGEGLGLCCRLVSSATVALLTHDGTMVVYWCAATFSRSASAAADSLTEVKGRMTSRWPNSSLAPWLLRST